MPPAVKPPAVAQIVSVGRVVHFVMPGASGAKPKHRAAMVVGVGEFGIEDSVELTIFLTAEDSREAVKRQRAVPYEASGKIPQTWHWPERDTGLDRMDQARAAAAAGGGAQVKDPNPGRSEDSNGPAR
jgi:hypothetical protein